MSENFLPTELNNLWVAEKINNKKDNGLKGEDFEENYKKIRAAYALNLCMVSISEIIKSKDQYIMDQEYNAILNNLNLENMPDDESLLKILKETLDVITYFKIQDGDKQFIEEDYKQALKQNLTNAVNISSLLGAVGNIRPTDLANPGTWINTGLSVATTVGVGYMNYRSGKTQAELNKKKQEWELQRSALEQLNRLRRELFDTSWHITKNFKIPDEYRLTENQINEYLEILNDTNDIRRFERLDFIKGNFLAYPPFWYQLGHTAKLIADSENEYKDKYQNYAKICFEFFDNITTVNLLRDDIIASSCALEYTELLDEKNDRPKIETLLDNAKKYSGDSNDVLQMCAIGYLRIGCTKKASRILWRLINEKYEENFNAELLSIIYGNLYEELNNNKKENIDIYTYLEDSNTEITVKTDAKDKASQEEQVASIKYFYNLLSDRVSEVSYLVPLPDEDQQFTESSIISDRKLLLVEKTDSVVNQIYKKYLIKFVALYIPESVINQTEFPDDLYEFNNWLNELMKKCTRYGLLQAVVETLNEDDCKIRAYYVLNDLYQCIGKFSEFSEDLESQLKSVIEVYGKNNFESEEKFENFKEENIKNNPDIFNVFDLINRISPYVMNYYFSKICELEKFGDLAKYENGLYLFSRDNGFNVPIIKNFSKPKAFKNTQMPYNIDPDIFGIEDLNSYEKAIQEKKELSKRIKEILNKDKSYIKNAEKVKLITADDKETFSEAVKGLEDKYRKESIVAIIAHEANFPKVKDTLIFTDNGIIWKNKGSHILYKDIYFDEKNELKLNGKTYSLDDIDKDKFKKAIKKIQDLVNVSESKELQQVQKAEIIVYCFVEMAKVDVEFPETMNGISSQLSMQIRMMKKIQEQFVIDEPLSENELRQLVETVKETNNTSKNIARLLEGKDTELSADDLSALTFAMGMSFIAYCNLAFGDKENEDSKALEKAKATMQKLFSKIIAVYSRAEKFYSKQIIIVAKEADNLIAKHIKNIINYNRTRINSHSKAPVIYSLTEYEKKNDLPEVFTIFIGDSSTAEKIYKENGKSRWDNFNREEHKYGLRYCTKKDTAVLIAREIKNENIDQFKEWVNEDYKTDGIETIRYTFLNDIYNDGDTTAPGMVSKVVITMFFSPLIALGQTLELLSNIMGSISNKLNADNVKYIQYDILIEKYLESMGALIPEK